ncbi:MULTISPECIES: hypothetical protein [unclassified Coleofasciculus]|uniref:hypothetical protein n=1 Tax=Cyanophyceae TaxID=3028117 RepID=UPI001F54CC41|nr:MULTISPECIES: hypothetical protein [unclassified Coleofasciculus]
MVKPPHRMMLMGAYIFAGLLFTKPAQGLVFPQHLPKPLVVSASIFLSAQPYTPSRVLEKIPPELSPEPTLDDFNANICQDIPMGVGVPGFQPGVHNSVVQRILGSPGVTTRGYWPNTRAISYQLIPDQVSLGFLFDKNSGLIRQTEASFAQWVNSEIVLVTLNSMLGCKLNDAIKQGLQQVQQRQSPKFFFSLESLRGVIERDKGDRVYIGIWEAGLH